MPNGRLPAGDIGDVVQIEQVQQIVQPRDRLPSSRRTTGSRSALAMKPERPRWCAPTRMLSRTLMLRNSATFWKVRPMPRPGHAVARQLLERAALELDVAVGEAVEAADAVEQRGLARAVGADQAADLAVADVERDAPSATTPPKRIATLDTRSSGAAASIRWGAWWIG